MTSTGIEVESIRKGSDGRQVSPALSLSVPSGNGFGMRDAKSAGGSMAIENVPASRHHDGRKISVRGFDAPERRAPVRHLVIFPARVL